MQINKIDSTAIFNRGFIRHSSYNAVNTINASHQLHDTFTKNNSYMSSTVLITVVSLFALSLAAAVILYFISQKFKVEENPLSNILVYPPSFNWFSGGGQSDVTIFKK